MSTDEPQEAAPAHEAPPPSAPPQAKEPSPPPPRGPLYDRLRRYVLPVLLLAGLVTFLITVHRHYPIQKWLFWRYAGYWLAGLSFCLGCLSMGHLTVTRLLKARLPLIEQLGTGFAVGVLEAFILMSLTGFLRLYGAPLFFALPVVMIASGAAPLYRYLRRAGRHLMYARKRSTPAPLWHFALVAFGLLGLLMIYALIMTPSNVQFDSRWKHFAVAEDYGVYGGIHKFPEGWTLGTDPQLPILLYTWAFQLPGRLFDRVELAAHIEFFLFVATTLTIPTLVRFLVPRRGVESGKGPQGQRTNALISWTARFAFPGVFLYDSSLSGGADHVAALFVVPLFLALLRAWRDHLSWRRCVLLAFMAAGGLMGKYTALLMLLPVPAVALLVRGLWLLKNRRSLPASEKNNWWLGPLSTLGAGLVLTAPHWLKNWVWYGDPVYPQLHAVLHLRPWTVDGADMFEWGYKDHQFWRPTRDLKGFGQTMGTLFTFSFGPNDWGKFHGKVPVFGSLYTLVLACVPFFRGTKRIWALVGSIQLAIFVWYWTHHQDRYLQTLLPWMTAVTSATLIMLWQQGTLTRIAASALVGAQIVWGGDVYFIPTHAMCKSPVKATIDFLARGYSRDYEARFKTYQDWVDVGAATAPGSVVLLHDIHVHLGIGRMTVSDFAGWQYGISYGRQKQPKDVWQLLRSMGVTHLAWTRAGSRGWDSVAGDLTFFSFVNKHGVDKRVVGGTLLAKMPAEPPPDEANDVVAYAGCGNQYKSGLYHLSDMTVPVYGPSNRKFPRAFKAKGNGPLDEFVKPAAYAVIDPKCAPGASAPLTAEGFKLVAHRKILTNTAGGSAEVELWLRTSGTVEMTGGQDADDDLPGPDPGRPADSGAPNPDSPPALPTAAPTASEKAGEKAP